MVSTSFDTAYRWANSDAYRTQFMETGHLHWWTTVRMDVGHVVDAARQIASDCGLDPDEITIHTSANGYGFDINVKGTS